MENTTVRTYAESDPNATFFSVRQTLERLLYRSLGRQDRPLSTKSSWPEFLPEETSRLRGYHGVWGKR